MSSKHRWLILASCIFSSISGTLIMVWQTGLLSYHLGVTRGSGASVDMVLLDKQVSHLNIMVMEIVRYELFKFQVVVFLAVEPIDQKGYQVLCQLRVAPYMLDEVGIRRDTFAKYIIESQDGFI